MFKKIFSVRNLKFLTCFLIPLLVVLIFVNQLDWDSWYVLAEGKQIAENGIYYADVLSMHDGLAVTVQNYGFAVIFYWIFSLFGGIGIYISMLILNVIICILLYKICMLISNKNTNLSLIIMMVTDLVLALGFVVTRAQMVSYVLFLGLIYILELYIRSGKARLLWWLPVLSLLEVNLHASLWPMLIVVTIVYIIDGIKAPKLHLQGYKIRPIIIAGVLMVVAGFLNPYGIKMLLLMFSSYGNTRFMELVVELKPFDLRNLLKILTYFAIVVAIVLQIFGNRRWIRIRYLLMFFGFLALGLNSIKGLSQFILVMFLPVASMYRDAIIKLIEVRKIRNIFLGWTSFVLTGCFVVVFFVVVLGVQSHPSDALVSALDSMDATVPEGIEKKGLKVYSGYDYGVGGYAELRGYRVYIDARGEVFLKANNGKEDILYEYIDFLSSKISRQELIDKYDFDYLLVCGEKDPFYNYEDSRYEILFDEDEVRLYKKVINV